MAKDVKAVIRAEVDPSGVVRGVAAVNRELQKINRSTGTTALASSFSMAQMAFGMIRQAFSAIDERMQEIQKMSTRFSPEAMRENMQTQLARIKQEQELGAALGHGTAAAEQIKQRAIAQETARLKRMGPESIAFNQSLKSDAGAIWDSILEQGAMLGVAPGTAIIDALMSQEDVKAWWSGSSGQELDAGRGSASRMPYDPQLQELKRQTQILQGEH